MKTLMLNPGKTVSTCICSDSFACSGTPFHREVQHLQVVETGVKNFSMMGCNQGATTPSYRTGRLAWKKRGD